MWGAVAEGEVGADGVVGVLEAPQFGGDSRVAGPIGSQRLVSALPGLLQDRSRRASLERSSGHSLTATIAPFMICTWRATTSSASEQTEVTYNWLTSYGEEGVD